MAPAVISSRRHPRHHSQQLQPDAPAGSRAAIYVRKSTREEDKAETDKSVVQQQRDARAFISSKGWTVADEHVFVDDAISGTFGIERRPGLKRLLETAEAGAIDVIDVASDDRLMRDQFELGAVLKRIMKTKVQLWYHNDRRRVMLRNAMEQFMEGGARGMASQMQIESTTKHAINALKDRAKLGQVFSGKTFGYTYVPDGPPEIVSSVSGKKKVKQRKRRAINEDEAKVIRKIFTLFVNGQSPNQIAKALTQEGALTSSRAGGHRRARWMGGTVREILLREVYAGTHHSIWPDGEEIVVRDKAWRIVSEPLWDKAQARFRENRAIYLRSTGGKLYGRPRLSNQMEAAYLLSGLLQCGSCGHGMVRVLRSQGPGRRPASMLQCQDAKRGRVTSCTNTLLLPMTAMEAEITEIVEATLDESIILEAVDGIIKARQQRPDVTKQHARDLARLTREIENLTAELAEGNRSAAVRDGIRLREEQVSRLMAASTPPVTTQDVASLRKRLPGILKDWTGLSSRHLQQSRQLLGKLFPERIVCTPVTSKAGGRYDFTGQVRLESIFAHQNNFKHLSRP